MQKAIDEAGVIFQIGHFMRGYPFYRFIKQLLDDGCLGAITRIRHCNVHPGAFGGLFDAGKGWYKDGWLWMTELEKSGVGAFGDLGAHSLDIMMWLMGDVLSVTAQMDRLLGKYPCDEYGEGMLRFANGAIGTLAGAGSIWSVLCPSMSQVRRASPMSMMTNCMYYRTTCLGRMAANGRTCPKRCHTPSSYS